jgi:hypothetical protein
MTLKQQILHLLYFNYLLFYLSHKLESNCSMVLAARKRKSSNSIQQKSLFKLPYIASYQSSFLFTVLYPAKGFLKLFQNSAEIQFTLHPAKNNN